MKAPRGIAVWFANLKTPLQRDSAGGTCISACAALCALVGVDRIDITLGNSANGAFVDTSAASNAIFTNLVSHSLYFL